MKYYTRLVIPLLVTLVLAFTKLYFGSISKDWEGMWSYLPHITTVLIICGFTWCLIVLMKILKKIFIRQYDMSEEDNLKARKVLTQINILVKVANFIIVLLGVGLILISFESVRKVGVGFCFCWCGGYYYRFFCSEGNRNIDRRDSDCSDAAIQT